MTNVDSLLVDFLVHLGEYLIILYHKLTDNGFLNNYQTVEPTRNLNYTDLFRNKLRRVVLFIFVFSSAVRNVKILFSIPERIKNV